MIKELTVFYGNILRDSLTILDAMKQLDEQKVKVLFVVDSQDRIIASLTDGDIRRAIINGIGIETNVGEIANRNPVLIDNYASIDSAEQIMSNRGINVIPVVDEDRRIQRLLYKTYEKESINERNVNVPIVIMAGGKGTRLYPYTKILPKPLIPIEDTPICERILDSFINVGCSQFYMVVNYKKNMIKAYFADKELDCNLEFVDETTFLGTGGGLKLLEGRLLKTFVLTNCDILVLEDIKSILDHHHQKKNDVTMVCSLKNFEIPYGTVEFSEGGEIIAFNEKPHMNFFTNTGYYIVEPCIMDYIGDNEEIGMPDIIDRMRKDGKKVGIYPISENSWLDMGQFETMDSMERRLRQLESDIDNCIGV